MDDKFWYLKNSDLFERLTSVQIEHLESRCLHRKIKRGEMIYLPNDASDSVLLVSSGRVKLYHITSDGKQALLAFVDPGEMFGELALLDTSKREEFAEAMEATTLILIPGSEIQQLMQEHPSVSVGVTKLMGFRMRRIERRLKSILFRSNRERLIHLLLELAEKYGRPTVEGVMLSIKLSHQELASIIGSTRETVTVVLGELQDEKNILIEKRRITLPNIKQLAASIDVTAPQLTQEEDLGNRLLRQSRLNT